MPPLRTIYRGLFTALTVMIVGLLPSTAHATPSISDVEKQIAAAWEKLEPVIEQYNKVHNDLLKNQKKLTALNKRIVPLSLQVDASLGQVADMATSFYMLGPASRMGSLLNAKSPDQFLDQLTMLEQIAQNQQAKIAGVSAQKDKFDAQKNELDLLVAKLKAQDKALAAQKKQIDAEMDRLQALRVQVYGSSTVGGSLRIGVCPPVVSFGDYKLAVAKACSLIGHYYKWGYNGPTYYDCSGLTQAAWAAGHESLEHYTGDQWDNAGTKHYTNSLSYVKANAVPGDLIFFYSGRTHVGIYIGNGLMVHAPHSGDQVRMGYISNMPINGYVHISA